MSVLICGSLAFDTITTFPGRFSQQILPDQVHILNVCFLVPTLKREYGGCAGNIAYSLKLLGGEPVPMATLGSDGEAYLQRLRELDIPASISNTAGTYVCNQVFYHLMHHWTGHQPAGFIHLPCLPEQVPRMTQVSHCPALPLQVQIRAVRELATLLALEG